MRPMNDPNYRYQPWSEERHKQASIAAKARIAAETRDDDTSREDQSITLFRKADGEKRGEIMAALTNLIYTFANSPAPDPEFLRAMMAFHTRLCHIVVREAADRIERWEAGIPTSSPASAAT